MEERDLLGKHEETERNAGVEKYDQMVQEKKAKLENELRFFEKFIDSIGEETFIRDMAVAVDKRNQFNLRIPKEFSEIVNLNSKKDRFMFKLTVPSLNSKDKARLEAKLVKNWNEASKELQITNKIITLEDTEQLVEKIISELNISKISYNDTELTILRVLLQKRKSVNSQEVASSTDLTWPTVNKYLKILNEKGLVKIVEKGRKKRTKWEFDFGYLKDLKSKLKD